MSEKPLSKRQQNILQFIWEYRAKHDRPPTIREIGKSANISSTSVVNYNLNRLQELGYLLREADVSRGISFTDKALQFLGAMVEKVDEVAGQVVERLGLVKVPLLGNIVAGQPIEVGNDGFAVYDEEDAIEVSTSMLKGRVDDLFALRVTGDSMIDAMVNDGDIVIMRKQQTANNGDMVAVWLAGDTTTLKYFYYDGDRIRLQPANPTMDPIMVEPETVQVQGKVMMVLRQTA
jgi:repressor LexA